MMSAISSNRKVPLLCAGHSRPVPDIYYSQALENDCFYLASSCLDGKPMLRDGKTGDWLGTFIGHKGAVWCTRLNSTAQHAITASADYTAKLWNAISGEEIHTFTHKRIVKTVDFTHDGKRIVSGGFEKILRVFNLDKPDVESTVLSGHTDTIKVAHWTPKSDTSLISGGADGVLRLWDTRTGNNTIATPTKNPIMSIEYSADGKIITVTSGREISFRDSSTLDVIKSFSMSFDLNTASLHPGNKYLVAGGSDFWVRLYDYETGKELELHRGHHGPIHCMKFAPDGETFASGSEDGTIRMWLTDNKDYGIWRLGGAATKETDSQTTESSTNN